MIKLQEIVGLPTLQYHLDNKLTLSECIYRYSSDSFVQLFAEARQALRDGKIQLNEQDVDLLENTDIGEYGLFEGVKVPLDLPMIDEGTFEDDEIAIYDGKDGLTYIYKRENGYYGYNDDFDFVAKDRDELEQKLNGWGYSLQAGSLDEGQHEMVCKKCNHDWTPELKDTHPALCHNCGYDNEKGAYDMKAFDKWKALNEAKVKGKDVALNKPKRGGPKKFYVYVKNPKSGNVKKVNFGDSGNLTVKLNEPGARAAFAARHKCASKKDKTSPGYWSCNIGRYWKSLGGNKNFSGYW